MTRGAAPTHDPGATFRDYAVRRAVAGAVVAMRDRAVHVVCGAPRGAMVSRGERSDDPVVVVACGDGIAGGPRTARGDVTRLPVLSESATGVWFDGALDEADAATRRAALCEAARLLQPGGVVVVILHATVGEFDALVAAAGEAGLAVIRRKPVHVADARASLPSILWPLSARAASSAAARAGADDVITAVLVAERRDPTALAMPSTREIVGSMFLPRSFRRKPAGHSPSSPGS